MVCVAKFSTEEEAVARANDSRYGLCASVWTENGGRQKRVSQGGADDTIQCAKMQNRLERNRRG